MPICIQARIQLGHTMKHHANSSLDNVLIPPNNKKTTKEAKSANTLHLYTIRK